MVTTTTSPDRAASATVTAFAPVSAARSASVSGPRELATATSCPSAFRRRVRVPPILPAPMMPIFMFDLLTMDGGHVLVARACCGAYRDHVVEPRDLVG